MSDSLAEALVEAAVDCDSAEVTRLLRQGANPNGFASDGYTALVVAVGQGEEGEECVRVLLDAGADPNLESRRKSATTPLISAACCGGKPALVELLLERRRCKPAEQRRHDAALLGLGESGGRPSPHRRAETCAAKYARVVELLQDTRKS